MEGRLGRPFSEVSEFRRVAPEAAVLRGGDEFGYPPSPRGGAEEAVDCDVDLDPLQFSLLLCVSIFLSKIGCLRPLCPKRLGHELPLVFKRR